MFNIYKVEKQLREKENLLNKKLQDADLNAAQKKKRK